MGADSPGAEEVTVTGPMAIFKFYRMGVVLSINVNRKRLEVETMAFFGIAFGFFDLADHSRVHIISLGKEK